MKYYRYMSREEFDKLMKGETINRIRSDNIPSRSQASDDDLCFLGEKTEVVSDGVADYWNAAMCFTFLSGIVSPEVLVEFESSCQLRKGQGTYADPNGDIWDMFSLVGVQTIPVDEYYCKEYSKDTMKPTRFCLDMYNLYPAFLSPRNCKDLNSIMRPISEYQS